MKDYKQAIADLEKALVVNSKVPSPKIWYRIGLTYYADGKYKKCIKTLKEALRNTRDVKEEVTYEADIFYHLGLSYCRLQKFEKSIYPFSQCVDKNQADIRYIHERAKAHQMIDMHEEAVKDFDEVIKKNPKNAHAHFRRAFSLKARGKYQEAADDFERTKQLDPLNPKLVVNYKKLKGVSCIVLCEPGEEKIFV